MRKYHPLVKTAKTWDFCSQFYVRNRFLNTKNTKDITNFGKWTKNKLIDLGPTYVKLGQVLSTRRDSFKPEFIQELETLQDQVPSVPFDDIQDIIYSELGGETQFNELFNWLSPEPYKAASLGQVHEGTLKNGRKVAVKIQRPGIENEIKNDIDNLIMIVTFFEDMGIDTGPGTITILEDSRDSLMQEINYLEEAKNTIRFTEIYSNKFPWLVIPKVYLKKSTQKILIMEWVEGTKITKVKSTQLADNLINFYMMQVMDYGFFHADPHPGNISVIPTTGEMIIYDWGLVTQLPKNIKDNLKIIIQCIAQRDTEKIVDILIDIGLILPTSSSKYEISIFFDRIIDYIYKIDPENIDSKEIKDEVIMSLSQEKPFILPSSILFLVKTFGLIEGVCKKLDPEFNFYNYFEPYLEETVKESLNLREMAQNTLEIPQKIESISTSVSIIQQQKTDIKKNISRQDRKILNLQYSTIAAVLAESSLEKEHWELFILFSLITAVFTFRNNRR